ncbi:MAG: hypothetical protein AAB423_00755 [Patescibacteria group bacterium]
MDRFIDGPLEPSRKRHIQSMFDEIHMGRAVSSVGNQAVAYVAGFIAINHENPLVTKDLENLLDTSFVVATRAANSLDRAGFINREVLAPKAHGKRSKLLIPQPELYEAIAITPEWKRATRICVLATELDLTVNQTIDATIRASLNSLEIEGRHLLL